MKVLWTLLYLAAGFASLFLGNKFTGSAMKQIGIGRQSPWLAIGAGALLTLLGFVQFFCLSGMFPLELILLLILAGLVAQGVYHLIGAFAGFTLARKQQKISLLGVILGAQKPVWGCVGMALSLVTFVVGTVGALWVFWRHPRGDPDAKVLIAFFQFILPLLTSIPVSILILWPTITSEYLDDDLRNSHLAARFCSILVSTLLLVFPMWLMRPEVEAFFSARGWPMLPFWLPVSLPFLLFIVGSLIPFFVGVLRHRSQVKVMSQWEERFLREVLPVLKLPLGPTRDRQIEERLDELRQELGERFSDKEVFRYYQGIALESTPTAEPAGPNALVLPPAPGPEPAAAPGTRLPIPQRIADLQRMVPRPLRPAPREKANFIETVQELVRTHKDRLVEWDIRFAHLRRLMQLGQVVLQGKTEDVVGFVEARLNQKKDENTQSSKRNVFAAGLLSILSSAIVWLFKQYESQILDLVDRLVG